MLSAARCKVCITWQPHAGLLDHVAMSVRMLCSYYGYNFTTDGYESELDTFDGEKKQSLVVAASTGDLRYTVTTGTASGLKQGGIL